MVKFIAEVSSNHNKSLDRSIEFIQAASKSNCTAVKFQLFKIDELFSKEVLNKSKTHRKRKEWELPIDFIPILYEKSKELNIQFSCSPFYLDAVDELKPYVDFYKIASYELIWDDLLIKCSKSNKPIVLSTGMATIDEIKHAVRVIKSNGCKDLTLLHCVSAYPTPYNEANLSAIKTIRDQVDCDVGWSDHTVDPSVINRAIHKWGANVIEFHLDLDGKGDEFKSGHCWLPNQIGELILSINKGFLSDGNGIKKPTKSEINDRDWRADPSDGLRPLKKIRKSWSNLK